MEEFHVRREISRRHCPLRTRIGFGTHREASEISLSRGPSRNERRIDNTACARRRATHSYLLVFVVLSGTLIPALLCAETALAQTQQKSIARAVSVQGTVEARPVGATTWQPVKLNDTFAAGDAVRVLERSRADLAMLDQSVLRLNANTELTIEAIKEERTGVVNLLRGAAHFFSRGPRSLEVQTPFTIAGVRGTEFLVSVEPDRTLLTIFEGTVLAENQAGSLTLTSGQSAVAESGKPPVIRVVARPRDAVHWALHYPPVLYFRPDEFPAGPDWQGMVRQSLEHYRTGDLQRALDSIATAPQSVPDPRFFAYRAHLLLAVGRADEAALDIERALRLNPNDADALALQTIAAVVQGERDKALDAAQRAVQAAPGSATAWIALSYAQQARFDLEGARASVEKAVALDPRNALAWARLSELWASFGELGRAFAAAEKAAALEPTLSRTQTVLGYAYLMRVKTKDARAAFEKAIALDSADPLPRLGLGLAKIRDGRLGEGSREIEAAASLDPNNALVRSYLGKAYYEEKRQGLDEREYEVAKQLDPNDPTPYFYDAIAKQTTNRPVEALHAMQQAIELNDNRAVYRSRLLLDADEAARSAAQARIYSDLGFQQLALVEGWKSVNTDPTNYSAHRFLADSYAVLPRHEIARVSELLQSQLLQPLNATPIQPRLAESNLFLVSAGGPGSLSFNEFNPLFNRDGVTFQTTGIAGSNATFAGEGILSGIYKNISFSFGYSDFRTNGWRHNADLRDTIGNAFVQLELSPETSIQAEYRYRQNERGDLIQRFFHENFFRGERNTEERNTFRVGGRHAFSPNSILLASLTYQKADVRLKDNEVGLPEEFADLRRPERAYSAELQHLFRSRYVNLTTGFGYFDIHGRIDRGFGFIIPPLFTIEDRVELDLVHYNAYAYAQITPMRSLTFTLGLSGDVTEGDSQDVAGKGEINPKFGVTWNPLPSTTVRAAAFRAFKRTLITDQTLEPTQVAGFNQFFDDFNGTTAWRYGVAIDQKFSKNIFGGVEYSKRDLDVPSIGPLNDVIKEDAEEQLGRAYVFWTPHPWLALTAEYIIERFKSPGVTSQPERVDTQRVPLGINFFHPSGFSAFLKATYVNQEVKLAKSANSRSGNDDFFIVDAAINYRLPRRYGFITVGVTNLFDENFKFFDRDIKNPSLQPDQMIYGKITLAVP
jgi:Flp pilus assembly protein TadD